VSVLVTRAGLQTCIQAGPRKSWRHLGVPSAGAADSLSLALANRLAGNPASAPALEITVTGPTLLFERDMQIALAGAVAEASLNGAALDYHRTVDVYAGDKLVMGSIAQGARAYLAFAGGLIADTVLGSASTYLPARLGGLDGRAIAAGDRLATASQATPRVHLETPVEFRPRHFSSWALRACLAAESGWLENNQLTQVIANNWIVGRRADRMGLELQGAVVETSETATLPSAPVFPGTVQLPPNGVPFLLGVDAQTTGGYLRILQVARVDRHTIGQLRPGDSLRFLPREPGQAAADLRAMHDYWREWLPDIEDVI
jgi:biotin-dependent carboxylase-like uncharacterized protein